MAHVDPQHGEFADRMCEFLFASLTEVSEALLAMLRAIDDDVKCLRDRLAAPSRCAVPAGRAPAACAHNRSPVQPNVQPIGIRRAGFGAPDALTACQSSEQRRSGVYLLAGIGRLWQAVKGRRAGGTGATSVAGRRFPSATAGRGPDDPIRCFYS